MKRLIPLLIAAIGGFALIVAYFLPATEAWGVELAVWFDILASIAFILGGGNLLKVHLQKVSDRKAGWGYSGVILGSFLLTLFLGLWKIGSHPADNTESYGESFAPLPVTRLPEYSVPLPGGYQATTASLPVSVRAQLAVTETELRFRGWPTPIQVNDLISFRPELEWQCAVETLAAQAVPPPELNGQIAYYADHGVLSFRGHMTEAEETSLRDVFRDQPPATLAVDELAQAARRPASISVPAPPLDWKIPATHADFVSLENQELRLLGPMSVALRSTLTDGWSAWPIVRPRSNVQRANYRREIEGDAAWNPEQVAAFEKALDAVWTPIQLQTALDSAGIPAPTEKTACECLAEKQSGVRDIQKIVSLTTPPQTLNPDQLAALDRLAYDPAATPDQFVDQLRTAGSLSDAQVGAIRKFFNAQPTVAQFERDLFLALRRLGPLTESQTERLLKGYRDQFAWRQAIGKLFVLAHRTKFPWSGDYTEQGTPFWWMYLYVLQPLMTTTFALLAFYVASAAFRAFRAKNLEATVLLVTSFIVLLRSTPIGATLSGLIPDSLSFLKLDVMTAFIMKVPNTAGNRAIMIGIALGIAATSLKVLLGLDRSYLGSDD